MHHELRCTPENYERIQCGSKTFELSENQKDFQMGDTISFHEFKEGFLDSPPLQFKIGFVFTISRSQVILSLIKLD